MKWYTFFVVLVVSFIVGCGKGEQKPDAATPPVQDATTHDTAIEGEKVEDEVKGSDDAELKTAEDLTTPDTTEEEDIGLPPITPGGTGIEGLPPVDLPAPAAAGDAPAAPSTDPLAPPPAAAGGPEAPPATPSTDPLAPAPAAPAPATPATDPLAPAPAAVGEPEAPPAMPATDPLAPAPAAGAETDPLAPAPAPAAEPGPASAVRTWIDSSGQHKIEAEFVSFKDGTVTLKKTDGKLTELPLEKLSDADQKYVKSLGQ